MKNLVLLFTLVFTFNSHALDELQDNLDEFVGDYEAVGAWYYKVEQKKKSFEIKNYIGKTFKIVRKEDKLHFNFPRSFAAGPAHHQVYKTFSCDSSYWAWYNLANSQGYPMAVPLRTKVYEKFRAEVTAKKIINNVEYTEGRDYKGKSFTRSLTFEDDGLLRAITVTVQHGYFQGHELLLKRK